jgi:hypothetical protein
METRKALITNQFFIAALSWGLIGEISRSASYSTHRERDERATTNPKLKLWRS